MNSAGLRTRQNGAAIRALRRKDGQLVSDLAETCGLHTQSLTNIENGFRQASWEMLHVIARALCVPVAAISNDPVPAVSDEDASGAVA